MKKMSLMVAMAILAVVGLKVAEREIDKRTAESRCGEDGDIVDKLLKAVEVVQDNVDIDVDSMKSEEEDTREELKAIEQIKEEEFPKEVEKLVK